MQQEFMFAAFLIYNIQIYNMIYTKNVLSSQFFVCNTFKYIWIIGNILNLTTFTSASRA